MNWPFIAVSFFVVVVVFLAAAVSLFLLQRNPPRRIFYIICSRPAPWRISSPSWNAFGQLVKLCTMYTTVRGSSSRWSWRFHFLLAQNYELLQSNNSLLGCQRVVETREEFHFSWVYAFSAMLSSLGNWANHEWVSEWVNEWVSLFGES